MSTLVCARCKTEVREEDARTDPVGLIYHQMCYQVASPGSAKNGVTVSGVDIPFLELTVLVFKLTLAGLLVGVVLGLAWWAFRLLIHS